MGTVEARFPTIAIVRTGILAGLIFAAFEMFAAALLMGPAAAAMPLRMIGAMVLGGPALDPSYSLAVAAMTGVVVHLVLSIAFAWILAAVASPFSSAVSLALAGTVFGTGLWLVNFYVVAPLAGWIWFPDATNPIVQFVAHAFFYGCPVGWLLSRSLVVIDRT
jgi:hypothetical protein